MRSGPDKLVHESGIPALNVCSNELIQIGLGVLLSLIVIAYLSADQRREQKGNITQFYGNVIPRRLALLRVGDTVLSVTPTSAETSAELTFVEPASYTYAGLYKGTVTFTISVDTDGNN